jgi:hypothetical protein
MGIGTQHMDQVMLNQDMSALLHPGAKAATDAACIDLAQGTEVHQFIVPVRILLDSDVPLRMGDDGCYTFHLEFL